MPLEDRPRTTDVVQVDQADEHEHRAQEGVKEELDGGVHPVGAAPHADHQEHRDQHGLEEHVEQQAVEGAEHAHHQAFHHQEGGHVLVHVFLDHFPGGQHHQRPEECRQQDQRNREAVYTKVVVDVEGGNPRVEFFELHRRGRRIEAHVKQHRNRQRGHGNNQRSHARKRSALLAKRHDSHAAENRQPGKYAKNRPGHQCAPQDLMTQMVNMPIKPRIMAKA